MTLLQHTKNLKICPECGNSLMNTARQCAVCGYRFSRVDPEPRRPQGSMQVTVSLPALIGLILFLLAMNTLVILGLQKRGQTKTQVIEAGTTATFVATHFVTLTPTPTVTRTPAPPTETPVADIEYVVVSGDSCISIAHQFNLYLDSLLAKNDIDCGLLTIGTVLRIPVPTATVGPTSTEGATPQP